VSEEISAKTNVVQSAALLWNSHCCCDDIRTAGSCEHCLTESAELVRM
jgi:hypothetical protein